MCERRSLDIGVPDRTRLFLSTLPGNAVPDFRMPSLRDWIVSGEISKANSLLILK
jgi:hypothetical protein